MASRRHSSTYLGEDLDTARAVSPSLDTSRLKTLGASQGARVTNRQNAAEAADRARRNAERRTASKRRLTGKNAPRYSARDRKAVVSGRQAVAIMVVALAVLVAAFFGVRAVLGSVTVEEPAATETERAETTVAQADVSDTVEIHGNTLGLVQAEDGTWWVAYVYGGGTIFSLEGTPAALIAYNGAVVVPESLDNGTWDVMALMMVDGSQAAQVVGADGNPVTGEGAITAVELDGTLLRVTDTTGATTAVALE